MPGKRPDPHCESGQEGVLQQKVEKIMKDRITPAQGDQLLAGTYAAGMSTG
jgi:hypothetical protein